jgi:glycosyltransferase involved in cell wall biosynthesis
VELQGLFGDDVAVVPKQQPEALAQAILASVEEPRRTRAATRERLEADFRLPGVARRYLEIYEEAAA